MRTRSLSSSISHDRSADHPALTSRSYLRARTVIHLTMISFGQLQAVAFHCKRMSLCLPSISGMRSADLHIRRKRSSAPGPPHTCRPSHPLPSRSSQPDLPESLRGRRARCSASASSNSGFRSRSGLSLPFTKRLSLGRVAEPFSGWRATPRDGVAPSAGPRAGGRRGLGCYSNHRRQQRRIRGVFRPQWKGLAASPLVRCPLHGASVAR